MLSRVDAFIATILSAVRWLALPVAALLFLQWPLRELVKAYSREANDLGQWLFAIFVAASVVAATRAHAHLASDALAQRFSSASRIRFAKAAIVLALLPWSAFVLWSGWPAIVRSVVGIERFPDTGNPAYFILKSALLLLLALIVLQAVIDLARPRGAQSGSPSGSE